MIHVSTSVEISAQDWDENNLDAGQMQTNAKMQLAPGYSLDRLVLRISCTLKELKPW